MGLGKTYHPNVTWTVVFRETGKAEGKSPGENEVLGHEEIDGDSPSFYAMLYFSYVRVPYQVDLKTPCLLSHQVSLKTGFWEFHITVTGPVGMPIT